MMTRQMFVMGFGAVVASGCGGWDGGGGSPPRLDQGSGKDAGLQGDGFSADVVISDSAADVPREGMQDGTVPNPDSEWEGPNPPAQRMVVITTSTIVDKSKKLLEFVEAKRMRGMMVTIATERDYGGAEERGRARALRIREWLSSRYRQFGYLLMIGDPNTEYGDVPMLKVQTNVQNGGCPEGIDCESSGTDSFFADPAGNWDLNGDGRYAEYGVDDGPGGVDLRAEMAVGRIPVYFGEVDELDLTLEHNLAYMNADPAQLGYRLKILLARSFVFFRGEIFFPGTPPIQEDVDTAEVSEWFAKNYLSSDRGVVVTRLYEQEGEVTSAYPSDRPLTEDNFVDEWKKGYGMIWWGGHGSPLGVARTVWRDDANHDGAAEGELSSFDLIQTEDGKRLEGAPGGFVVASSCLVGRIEVPYSLSYSLIRHGAAVGVVASSAPATLDEGGFRSMGSELDRKRFDLDRLAVLLWDGLIQGGSVGRIVADSRVVLGQKNDLTSYEAKLMVNYYGDPSLTLYDSAADVR